MLTSLQLQGRGSRLVSWDGKKSICPDDIDLHSAMYIGLHVFLCNIRYDSLLGARFAGPSVS